LAACGAGTASGAGAAALAASISALFAALYTWLTFRLVRSQSEPNVVVYVKHDYSRTTILQIIVENIGRGIANDIRFKSSRPIPAQAMGVAVDEAKRAVTMTEGPLIEGIPALGPGDSRRITWGQFGGLVKELGDEKIILEYEYKDGHRKMPSREAILEYQSFKGTDANDSEAVRMIRELRRVADALERIKTNSEGYGYSLENLTTSVDDIQRSLDRLITHSRRAFIRSAHFAPHDRRR